MLRSRADHSLGRTARIWSRGAMASNSDGKVPCPRPGHRPSVLQDVRRRPKDAVPETGRGVHEQDPYL
jgi:hypothetical protein